MPKKIKQKIIEILRGYSSFSMRERGNVIIGICVKEYLADMKIPRKDNKKEIEFEKELNELVDQILSLFPDREEIAKKLEREKKETAFTEGILRDKDVNFNQGIEIAIKVMRGESVQVKPKNRAKKV